MPSLYIGYYYKKKFENFEMRNRHLHEDIEIMYVSSGQCVVSTPMGRRRVETGQFIVLGRGVPHALHADKADIMNLEFFLNYPDGFDVSEAYKMPGVEQVLSAECEVYTDDGSVYPALRDVVREQQTVGNGYMTQVLMNRLLILLGRLWGEERRNSGGTTYVKKAKEYIIRHCDEKISVLNVAKEVGVNVSYLQNLFKKYTNTTITEFANILRVEKACFLLRNSDMDTTEIALECGFASRQHFGLTFRKIIGCSPNVFRKSDIQ